MENKNMATEQNGVQAQTHVGEVISPQSDVPGVISTPESQLKWIVSITNWNILSTVDNIKPELSTNSGDVKVAPLISTRIRNEVSETIIPNLVTDFVQDHGIDAEMFVDDYIQVICDTPQYKAYRIELEYNSDDVEIEEEDKIEIFVQFQAVSVRI